MRANDYKIKFFEFLAENLRRLATRLSVKPPLESSTLSDEKPASALEDWLARVRKVSPENWVDFAAGNELEPQVRENEFEPEIQPPDLHFVDEAGEDFIPERSKNQTPVKTFFENRRKALKTGEIFDNPVVSKKREASDNPEISYQSEPSAKPEVLNKFEISNKSGSLAEPEILNKPETFDKPEIFDNPNISNKSEASVKNEAFLTEKPEKPKTGARFFSFKTAGEKRAEENAEALEPSSENPRQSAAKDEKPLATAKRNFRLSAAEFAFENKPETSASPAPDIINFVENQAPPKFEIPAFEQKKSAAPKPEEIAPSKPENTSEKPGRIVKKPRGGREISGRFPLESFAPKNERETAAKISFALPKRKTDSAAALSPKAKQAPDVPVFSSPRKKSKNDAEKYFKLEREKKTDDRPDNIENFAVAESPWADLPDEAAFQASGDVQINLSENEHLRFLEGEQAGKI